MKKLLRTFLISIMILVMAVMSVMPAFATNTLTVNGVKNLKKGDIISYTLNLSDCEEEIIGFQMYIYYDKEYLDVVTNTVEFPQLSNVAYNDNSDSGILFNWTSVTNPADFSTEAPLINVDFSVIKGGNTEISYFVAELYGEDMTYLKSYTFTCDMSVNDEQKLDNQVPIVTDKKDFVNKNQGSFINYVDGKGEKNGDTGKNRETVVGSTEKAPEHNLPIGEVSNEKEDSKEGAKDKKSGINMLLIGGLFLLVLVGLAVFIIIRVVLRPGVNVDPDEKN